MRPVRRRSHNCRKKEVYFFIDKFSRSAKKIIVGKISSFIPLSRAEGGPLTMRLRVSGRWRKRSCSETHRGALLNFITYRMHSNLYCRSPWIALLGRYKPFSRTDRQNFLRWRKARNYYRPSPVIDDFPKRAFLV